MTSKRKNSFNSDWEKEYEFVKRSRKGESYFYCSICQKDYNVESMGVSAITAHKNYKAHKQIVEERRKSSTMAQFVVNKSAPTPIDFKIAAAEGIIFLGYNFFKFPTISSRNCWKKFILMINTNSWNKNK